MAFGAEELDCRQTEGLAMTLRSFVTVSNHPQSIDEKLFCSDTTVESLNGTARNSPPPEIGQT